MCLDVLLPGKELFFLYRGEPFAQWDPLGGSRRDLKQRADFAPEYLCGAGGGLYHVRILHFVPEGGHVAWGRRFL